VTQREGSSANEIVLVCQIALANSSATQNEAWIASDNMEQPRVGGIDDNKKVSTGSWGIQRQQKHDCSLPRHSTVVR
jgi:hypothetical protein